jgi:GT2 family glycosyltransferase
MVAIIILNYNNAKDTINSIESVEKYNTFPSKFIIIDNASTNGSADQIKKYLIQREQSTVGFYHEGDCVHSSAPYISFIQSSVNGGYACGNNIALKFIENDSDITKILVLNNDVLFTQDIIPELSDFLDKHTETAIVSPVLLKKDGVSYDYNCARKNCTTTELLAVYAFQSRFLWKYISSFAEKRWMIKNDPTLLSKEYFEIELPSGSCMMIRKEDFKQIGYFDSRTFLYYEENILFKKIEKISKKNYMIPSLQCIHLGGSTMKQTKFSKFQLIQINLSAYIYAKYYSGMNGFSLFLLTVLYRLCKIKIQLVHLLKEKRCR